MLPPTTLRIGITGLARAGKTALLTSIAANLLASPTNLPALTTALKGRRLHIAPTPTTPTNPLPPFDTATHLAHLAQDPPTWPARTNAVSLLALTLTLDRPGLLAALPPRQIRLELLDYPGEWLLDLPLLALDYSTWSEQTLRHLQTPHAAAIAAPFLAYTTALPTHAPATETLAATGHALFQTTLHRLRDEAGLTNLQPGRFLMPPAGSSPPWLAFFPTRGHAPLTTLLATRYDSYRAAIRAELVSPAFGQLDRLVVLVDLLAALHAGPIAYADTAAALAAVAAALRWQFPALPWKAWPHQLGFLNRLRLPHFLQPGGIRRVAYVASKADHVAQRQRGNLARLVASLTQSPNPTLPTLAIAIAAIRCTEDFVWTLEGRPVSAVRGRVLGSDRLTRSYPGEVPDSAPTPDFWNHPFLALPNFEPIRLPDAGRAGAPHLELDRLLLFLLEDVL